MSDDFLPTNGDVCELKKKKISSVHNTHQKTFVLGSDNSQMWKLQMPSKQTTPQLPAGACSCHSAPATRKGSRDSSEHQSSVTGRSP